MKIRLSDLWRWDGTVDRGPYFVLGLGLALIKFNLDRFVTHHLTGRRWDPLHCIHGRVLDHIKRRAEGP